MTNVTIGVDSYNLEKTLNKLTTSISTYNPFYSVKDDYEYFLKTKNMNTKGIYEYIIYSLEDIHTLDKEFEVIEKGEKYGSSEQDVKEQILFNFAKTDLGKKLELSDFKIKIRFFG